MVFIDFLTKWQRKWHFINSKSTFKLIGKTSNQKILTFLNLSQSKFVYIQRFISLCQLFKQRKFLEKVEFGLAKHYIFFRYCACISTGAFNGVVNARIAYALVSPSMTVVTQTFTPTTVCLYFTFSVIGQFGCVVMVTKH